MTEIATILGLKPKSKATKIALIDMIRSHEAKSVTVSGLTPKQQKRLRLKGNREAA